jgi:hypothetical protein
MLNRIKERGLNDRGRGRNLRAALTCAVVPLACAGCAQSQKAKTEVWTPKPRVEWEQLGVPPGSGTENAFRILTAGTSGLFPANAAVTRVALTADEVGDGETQEPHLYADPRNEFLQWNSVFDDQMAVSEVFPIDQRDLGGGAADPIQILAAFRGLHARLGLIYAVNELSPSQSEMFGVLYSVDETKPLATIHARAESLPLPEEAEEPEDPYHLWKTDSRALVRGQFAELAHACVRQLIQHDQPVRTDAPEGWTPAGPIQPVDWPPRHRTPRGRP